MRIIDYFLSGRSADEVISESLSQAIDIPHCIVYNRLKSLYYDSIGYPYRIGKIKVYGGYECEWFDGKVFHVGGGVVEVRHSRMGEYLFSTLNPRPVVVPRVKHQDIIAFIKKSCLEFAEQHQEFSDLVRGWISFSETDIDGYYICC